MKKCKCGNTLFTVVETIVHKAELVNNILYCSGVESHLINLVMCQDCQRIYKDNDFKNIQFN